MSEPQMSRLQVSGPRAAPRRWLAIWPWAALVAAYAAFLFVFLPLLPANGTGMGGDYAIHLPNLLAGYFHILANGPLSPPWFNPGLCGGVPFLADLNVGFYTLPQWLMLAVDPVAAIRWTLAVFAGAGAVGFYVLMRRRFHASAAASLAAAVLFLFNGFFVYRMAIGHLTFHPFALLPWVAFLVLTPIRQPESLAVRLARSALATIAAGFLFAYMFQAGMVHGILPVALAVAMILFLHGYLRGFALAPWIMLGLSAVVALLLSAQRLVAALAFLDAFPRAGYRLPGFRHFTNAIYYALESLFLRPDAKSAQAAMTNVQWALYQHEWEYGVGPAAAILIVAGLVVIILHAIRNGAKRPRFRTAIVTSVLAVGLAIPVFLNWYEEAWNTFLKSLPIFGSSSTHVRWFAVYIPVAALFAGLAVDAISPQMRARVAAAAAMIVATVAWNATADLTHYTSQSYPGDRFIAAWQGVQSAEAIPPVVEIGVTFDEQHRAVISADNLEIIQGISPLFCYQPMFGYALEAFDPGPMRPGSVMDLVDENHINLKNPACYLYPTENRCAPGDPFTVGQIEEAFRFVQYQDFPFERSRAQMIADTVNLIALVASIIILIGSAIVLLATGRPSRRTM